MEAISLAKTLPYLLGDVNGVVLSDAVAVPTCTTETLGEAKSTVPRLNAPNMMGCPMHAAIRPQTPVLYPLLSSK